jgi:hypothetical protein
MMTSLHYLTTSKQMANRKEVAIKEHACMKQKQLTNKEKQVLEKVNIKVAKQQRILYRETKKRFDEA